MGYVSICGGERRRCGAYDSGCVLCKTGHESLRLRRQNSAFIPRARRDWLRSGNHLSTYLIQHLQIVQGMGLDTTAPLISQVGGHAGVSTSEDGSLVIKPALAREVSFYQHLNSNPVFASLRPHIPKFYGTLRLEGTVEDGNLETLRKTPKAGKDKCFSTWESPSGDRPCIYNDDTFDSIGESVK